VWRRRDFQSPPIYIREEGRAEGQNLLAALITKLFAANRSADAELAAEDILSTHIHLNGLLWHFQLPYGQFSFL